MASFPVVGGARKKLTLQTKKRYQLSSPVTTKQPKSEEKSKPPSTSRCDDTLRLPVPLDLRKCPGESVIVLDDPTDTCDHKVPDFKTPCKQHVSVATPFMQQHRVASHDHDIVQKGMRRAHSTHVIQATVTHQRDINTTLKNKGHYTQQKKPSFLNNDHLHRSSHKHESSSSVISHQTSNNHSNTDGRGIIKTSTHNQVLSCHKRTWIEVNDEDDEFDELCQMVDLSDSFDDSELVSVTTPDSNHGYNTWTCPMCNEIFIGRSAEEHENHLVQCLAMDVV
ncbi:uncharacterized protein [Dysidea avara]|uniref:uncharacterized protein isoform X2 n=1 Tax=Dysidea avara TaxID=196820 RepID=UPI003327418F